MAQKFGKLTLGKITDVKTVNGNTSVYYCRVELEEEGYEAEVAPYVACANDTVETGKWVYAQITAGNFEGALVDIPDTIDPFTGEPIANRLREEALRQRNKLLGSTDWTQMPDVSQTVKDLWAPYRQALRDVPQQAGFPDNIVWPTPPQ